LKNVIPENLESYADIYQKLFGINDLLQSAIQRASEFDSKEVKLWALSQAFKNKIVEPWVIEVFGESVDVIPTEKLVRTLGNHWPHFRYYLSFPLSQKGRLAIAYALLAGIDERYSPFVLPPEVIDELSKIKPDCEPRKNFLYLWAVCQLSIISRVSAEEPEEYIRRGLAIQVILPGIVNPNVKKIINKNASLIRNFCETFSEENEPFTKFLVAVFSFLLEPHNPDKYINISKTLQEKEIRTLPPRIMVPSILGLLPEDEEKLYEYHENFRTLYEYYSSEEQYRGDVEQLNELINKESENIKNHPHKLDVWIDYNCDPTIEKFLDPKILCELKGWLQHRGLSENAISLCGRMISVIGELEFSKFVLGIVENQLKDKRKPIKLWAINWISDYEWHEPKTEQELSIANRLRHIFEEVLAYYLPTIDLDYRQLEILYWPALSAGVVEEKQMAELYKIIRNDPNFPFMPSWYREAENVQTSLVNMLQSENLEIARLAAVSSTMMLRSPHPKSRRIEETWIGNKFWELARDEEDIWRPRYIQGMAYCRLKWAEKCEEWLEAIKAAKTEELQNVWSGVIERASYCEDKDRNALFNLLLRILESGNSFAKPIRLAALQQLYEIVSEMEPVGFDEESLNLPLPRRARIQLS
jgi:hypothetical protein